MLRQLVRRKVWRKKVSGRCMSVYAKLREGRSETEGNEKCNGIMTMWTLLRDIVGKK